MGQISFSLVDVVVLSPFSSPVSFFLVSCDSIIISVFQFWVSIGWYLQAGLSDWNLSGLWDVASGYPRITHTGKSEEETTLLNYSARNIQLFRLLLQTSGERSFTIMQEATA